MVDFVEEVEERLRAERYAGLARRYLPWVIAAVVATIVGWLGVWGYDAWRDRNIGQASIAYDKAMVELAGGDQTGAYNAFAPIARSGPPAYRALALMQQANIRLGAGKGPEALALYDAAAKAAPNQIFGDLARLRAAQVVMDTAPYAQIETRLKALVGDNHPYSLEAKEMLAMAKLQAGKAQEARGDFNALSLTLGVTPGMRARAQGAIALIDSGQAPLVGQVVRSAATLPPPSGAMSPPLDGAPPAQASDQTPAGNAQ
ncbi:MAG: hypothetical protein JWO83_2071 [Caulobacteraceae bacterium]|nr:hypothetical protein [Caulobacteraceae bacterium]